RPLLVGARSVHVGIKPNDDPAKEITDRNATGRLLEWLVFDALGCTPAADPLLVPSPTPDSPQERRVTPARRGALSALEALGVTADEIAARFGRPVQHVATTRLTALVRAVITARHVGGTEDVTRARGGVA
ncbi:hypothetical protein, partial [Geodermatophilus sp. SYSU D00815]